MSDVELVPMTAAQYEAWLPTSVADYAQEHVVTGRWSAEEALRRSREEFDRLLPQGLATPGHDIWSIARTADHEAVGVLWIQAVDKPEPHAFIFNIEIFEPFRRRGYATRAMTLLEKTAGDRGLRSVRLHVFGHNTAARPLYEKRGYVPTNIQMLKRLT